MAAGGHPLPEEAFGGAAALWALHDDPSTPNTVRVEEGEAALWNATLLRRPILIEPACALLGRITTCDPLFTKAPKFYLPATTAMAFSNVHRNWSQGHGIDSEVLQQAYCQTAMLAGRVATAHTQRVSDNTAKDPYVSYLSPVTYMSLINRMDDIDCVVLPPPPRIRRGEVIEFGKCNAIAVVNGRMVSLMVQSHIARQSTPANYRVTLSHNYMALKQMHPVAFAGLEGSRRKKELDAVRYIARLLGKEAGTGILTRQEQDLLDNRGDRYLQNLKRVATKASSFD